LAFYTFYNNQLRIAIAQITDDGKYLIEVQDLAVIGSITQFVTPEELLQIYTSIGQALGIKNTDKDEQIAVLNDELEHHSNLPVLLQTTAEYTNLQNEYDQLHTKYINLRKRAGSKWTALYDIAIEQADRDTAILREMNEKLTQNLEVKSVQGALIFDLIQFLVAYEAETSDPFYKEHAFEVIDKVKEKLLQQGGDHNNHLAQAIEEHQKKKGM
jgi:hypothetical protein